MTVARPGRRRTAAVFTLLTICAVGGCAGEKPGASPPPQQRSVRDIATAIGCTADITVDATELRQAACRTARGEFRMVTFSADRGQRAWLTEARSYGGTYLVGERWIVTAQAPGTLAALRDKLGGTIEAGAAHDHAEADGGGMTHSH